MYTLWLLYYIAKTSPTPNLCIVIVWVSSVYSLLRRVRRKEGLGAHTPPSYARILWAVSAACFALLPCLMIPSALIVINTLYCSRLNCGWNVLRKGPTTSAGTALARSYVVFLSQTICPFCFLLMQLGTEFCFVLSAFEIYLRNFFIFLLVEKNKLHF